MNLLGLKVNHKVFGVGEIVEYKDNYITVAFPGKTTKFVYPNAFETFIKVVDDNVQEFIVSEIEKAKIIDEAKKRLSDASRKAEEAIRNLESAKNIKKGLIEAIQHAENAKKRIEEEIQYVNELGYDLQVEIRRAEGVKTQLEEKIQYAKNAEFDGLFGKDYHVEYLAKHPILTYQQVERDFGISLHPYGRGINPTDSTVVLISVIKKGGGYFVYHDKWTADGDYIYSGEGRVGDQIMAKGNLAIKNAARDGREIHLFVKFSPQEYYYQGVFVLVDYTYEDDRDENGDIRKEYKFRLRKAK